MRFAVILLGTDFREEMARWSHGVRSEIRQAMFSVGLWKIKLWNISSIKISDINREKIWQVPLGTEVLFFWGGGECLLFKMCWGICSRCQRNCLSQRVYNTQPETAYPSLLLQTSSTHGRKVLETITWVCLWRRWWHCHLKINKAWMLSQRRDLVAEAG